MPIIQQSALVSHSPLLALPAPRIAGLLPAPAPAFRPPDPPMFTFRDPRLADLPNGKRERLFMAAQTLLNVALGHLDGTLSDHALNTALALFRRTVTGQSVRPMTPTQYTAEKDVVLLEWLAERGGLAPQRDEKPPLTPAPFPHASGGKGEIPLIFSKLGY